MKGNDYTEGDNLSRGGGGMSTGIWIVICSGCFGVGYVVGSAVTLKVSLHFQQKQHEKAIEEIKKLGEWCRGELMKAYDERDRILDVRQQIDSNPFPTRWG
jgi:hypothetical protein